jgi:Rrf2 family nitric oxide-sensitive transcriptional repressor
VISRELSGNVAKTRINPDYRLSLEILPLMIQNLGHIVSSAVFRWYSPLIDPAAILRHCRSRIQPAAGHRPTSGRAANQASHVEENPMISQTVEYALRAIVTIAQHDGRPCTSAEIAATTKVPGPYLSKLMQGLARGGLVKSQRGLHGGFVLSRDPQTMTLWEVVDVVEPFQRIRSCPLEIQSHSGTLCPLHRSLDNVMQAVEQMFREMTVASMLSQPGSVSPLCEAQKLISIGPGK